MSQATKYYRQVRLASDHSNPSRKCSIMLSVCRSIVVLGCPFVFRQKLYCDGNGVLDISIEGGTFRGNTALEAGGAIIIWGDPVLVTITGGTFEGNTTS